MVRNDIGKRSVISVEFIFYRTTRNIRGLYNDYLSPVIKYIGMFTMPPKTKANPHITLA